jgi:3-deoxy-D-manno-octulosonic-acid transferase
VRDQLVWFAYNILFAIGFTLMLPKFLMRMWRRGGYRVGFMQRFGRYDAALLAAIQDRPRIWVHAVSVGEVFVALHFIEVMRSAFPGTGYILTTTTSTGHALAKEKLAEEDVLLYFSADFPAIARRVVQTLKPVAVLLTESELWPNLLRQLRAAQVPVFVINGRMSASSFRGYRKVLPFFTRAVAMVDRLFVQSSVDRDRMLALGAPAERIMVMGSAKYDVAQPDPDGVGIARRILTEAGMDPDGTLLVGGSTWPGEESVLLDIFVRLRERNPALQLILVPRHMERREDVEALLKARGLSYVKRTDMVGKAEIGNPKSKIGERGGDGCEVAKAGAKGPCVLLADTTGELKHYYAIGAVIFVGKSLGDNVGGQNPIEPAMVGKPIVVGPHMENFPGVMDDFLAADALVQVADSAELEAQLVLLLGSPEAREAYGDRAGALVAEKRGVVDRSIAAMKERMA